MFNCAENQLKGFISYSHEDAKEVADLKKQLDDFTKDCPLTIWYDREISPGIQWEPEIEKQIKEADIVIFCISDSFLKSDLCRKEFKQVLELKRKTHSEIIPVILKTCAWLEEMEISQFQATPSYGKPIMSFKQIEDAYNQIKSALRDKINLVLQKKQLSFTESHREMLQALDPLLSVSGSEHLDLKLDDIYVDLELSDQQDNKQEAKTVEGKELIDRLINGENILIAGAPQSGKTSLCKKICILLFSENHYPVYISSEDGYRGDVEKLVKRCIKNQYSTPNCIDSQRTILIFDDFHKCRNFEKFLPKLPPHCSILLTLEDLYYLHLSNAVAFKDFHSFDILPLRARKRDELIKKWLESSKNNNYNHGPLDNYQTHDRLVTQVESTLGKFLGRGLIPAYPFYILSILIASEFAFKPLSQEISSQGYCYQVLLYAVLSRVGIYNQQIDMYVNFLSELAYMLFKHHASKSCSHADLSQFTKDYTDKFSVPVATEQIFETLDKARIFGKTSLGMYDFHYPYLKYYFIAKYLAEHFNECEADFEGLFSNLGSTANGYIAIFVAHHERSVQYLRVIVSKLSHVFSGATGCYLSNTDLRDFDKQSRLIVQAALPSSKNNPDFEREKALVEKEKSEDMKADFDSSEDEMNDPKLRDLVIGVRLCQVIGQILKIRPSSIQRDIQKTMIRGIIDAYARILRTFFDTFKDSKSQESIIDYISHVLSERGNNPNHSHNPEKVRRIAERIFWNLNFVTTYGLVIHCVCAIGSTELFNIIKESCTTKDDAPLTIVIPQMVNILYNKTIDVDAIKKIFPKLSLTVQNMLKFVVVYYCRFHHVRYNERQKVEQLFGLKSLLPMYIQAQKEKTY